MSKQPKQTPLWGKKIHIFFFWKASSVLAKYLKSELKSFSKINNSACDPKLGPHVDAKATNAAHLGSALLPALLACLWGDDDNSVFGLEGACEFFRSSHEGKGTRKNENKCLSRQNSQTMGFILLICPQTLPPFEALLQGLDDAKMGLEGGESLWWIKLEQGTRIKLEDRLAQPLALQQISK